MLSRAALRTARAAGSAKPALQGAKVAFSPGVEELVFESLTNSQQRSASSAAAEVGSASPRNLNIHAGIASVAAVGSIAWYYHLYGQELHAMTPAEEGYVDILKEKDLSRSECELDNRY